MHLSSAIVFTVVAIALMCSAVKASPISLFELDDEPSIDELKAIPPEQGNNFKRICGMSLIGCRRVRYVYFVSSVFELSKKMLG